MTVTMMRFRSAFKAEETSKCDDPVSLKGDGNFTRQVNNTWICGSGASAHMTPTADQTQNYKDCNLKLKITGSTICGIERCGDSSFVDPEVIWLMGC